MRMDGFATYIEGEKAMNRIWLGNRIREARERRHLTQEKLSEIVDISPTHMSVLERGVKGMKLSTFIKIANALDVSADELLQDELTHETQLHSIILYELIDEVPVVEQRKLVHMIKAYIESYKKFSA